MSASGEAKMISRRRGRRHAMGSGIAQVAAAAGHRVVLSDAKAGASGKARETMNASLRKTRGKGETDVRRARQNYSAALLSLTRCSPATCSIYKACGIVIEAVVEDLAVKRTLLTTLGAAVAPGAILATNTSSLSVASLASAPVPPRTSRGGHSFSTLRR